MPAPDLPRYHVTLTLDGRPAAHGWWQSRATADLKYRAWIGERGSIPGARITLVDETTGAELSSWP
ncbi:hypothetical protein [Streptomyces wuyuanensis]|uniref:Uncharacterized protein n=1 Tax=Streptomyces wuyuanensis TaxID=1196353 RepID=A0A1G9ZAI1_9ACTN|nr:hypothetical protein [Streptomyces wuyuanensis]SDN17483.1 hypothetical protein SAMN05444921_1216 [Streptomyces wuyuanensis]